MAAVRSVASSGGGDLPYQGSVAVPSGAEVGDLLVICHIVDNDIASPDAMTALSAGFTAQAAYGPQYQPRLKLWTKSITAQDIGQSMSFQHNTASGARSWALIALACSDTDPDNPLAATPATAVVQSGGGTAKNTLSNASLTPDSDNALSIVFGSGTRYATADTNVQFYTPPTNWVERYDVGQNWLKPTVYTRDNVTGPTGTANATIANSGANSGWSSMHVVLRHKASGPESGRFLIASF